MLRTFYTEGEYGLATAQGVNRGHTPYTPFGQANNVPLTGTAVWSAGGDYTGQPSGARQQVEVVSSSPNDHYQGTGMQQCMVMGLRRDTDEVYETKLLNMTGTTPNTFGKWFRIVQIVGVRYGSGGTNEGAVTVRQTPSPTTVFAIANPGRGESHTAVGTVPANRTGFMLQARVELAYPANVPVSGEIALRYRVPGSNGYNVSVAQVITNTRGVDWMPVLPAPMPPGTDFIGQMENVSLAGACVATALQFVFINSDKTQ